MRRVTHLVIGPDRHGVVLHSLQIAAACGQQVIRQLVSEPERLVLRDTDVLQVGYTDRLFAPTAEASAAAFARLADAADAAGVALSVTLHDVPAGDSALQLRRARGYAAVTARCRGVVVNSWSELARVQDVCGHVRSLRVIGLPIDPVPDVLAAPAGSDVVVLGYLYPDRGYEQVLSELPDGSELVALGTASDGHEDLPEIYAELARQAGRRWQCSGYLDDGELSRRLASAAVAVAPNPRVSASGSINSWLTHGRRPLVARSPYAEEFEREHPGCIALYDPDEPGQLHGLITDRLRDPGLTVLDPGRRVSSNLDRVATAYLDHLDACRPPVPIEVHGRYLVPGNRWDLVPAGDRPAPEVSVIVPYYRAQAQLDLVLTGLSLQTHPASRLQIIVADDGSPTPPRLDAANLPVQLVRQDDRGFRAAAARNLGAAAAEGQVLVFLDGDTVPEPSYVERLVRLPTAAHDVLVTGRRRHADLSAMTPVGLAEWLSGSAAPPVELPAPRWLSDGYRASDDLLEVDRSSYRLVISAVLGVDRALFAELEGFDATIEGYGGEDWELAYRAYQAGAVFAHEPTAVAWHDGADWGGREVAGRQSVKNAETMMLALRIPDPNIRDGRAWPGRPAVVIVLPAGDDVLTLATARAAFAAVPDCGIWLDGPDAARAAARLADPRIAAGTPPAPVLASCRVVVELDGPADLAALGRVADLAERVDEVVMQGGRVRSNRAIAQARRWRAALADVSEPANLHGGQDRVDLGPWPADLDLSRLLTHLRGRSQA